MDCPENYPYFDGKKCTYCPENTFWNTTKK